MFGDVGAKGRGDEGLSSVRFCFVGASTGSEGWSSDKLLESRLDRLDLELSKNKVNQ